MVTVHVGGLFILGFICLVFGWWCGYALGYRMREEQLKIDIEAQAREAKLQHPSNHLRIVGE